MGPLRDSSCGKGLGTLMLLVSSLECQVSPVSGVGHFLRHDGLRFQGGKVVVNRGSLAQFPQPSGFAEYSEMSIWILLESVWLRGPVAFYTHQ